MNVLRSIGIPAVMLIVVGCAALDELDPARERAPAAAANRLSVPVVEDYRIGVGDQVQVNVWRNPELSISGTVRPDGKITVPLIGDIRVDGRPPSEVAESIKKELSAFVREPHVAVIVTAMVSNEYLSRVRVLGAVRSPKSIPHRQGMTVLDAVLAAGGVNEFASANNAKLYRKSKDKTEVFDIELDEMLKRGRLENNVLLRPGDVITVPERLF